MHVNSLLAMKGVEIEIHLARGKAEVMELLEKDGVDKIIGHDHIMSLKKHKRI